jgi:amidase/aspartyl-tRNA(Asn)/glutamyl-tRNA(Gln) amidotransferase subunit A
MAHEYLDLQVGRTAWIAKMQAQLNQYDAALSPTVPIEGPTLESVAPGAERDEVFFKANGLLLRNTSVVNTLDGCGISLPCHAPGTLPVGLMAWHAAMHDDTILQLSLLLEPLLQKH